MLATSERIYYDLELRTEREWGADMKCEVTPRSLLAHFRLRVRLRHPDYDDTSWIEVAAETLLDYRRLQAELLTRLGMLYRHPAAEGRDGCEPSHAWLDYVGELLGEPEWQARAEKRPAVQDLHPVG
jgi:hypothetical protein